MQLLQLLEIMQCWLAVYEMRGCLRISTHQRHSTHRSNQLQATCGALPSVATAGSKVKGQPTLTAFHCRSNRYCSATKRLISVANSLRASATAFASCDLQA